MSEERDELFADRFKGLTDEEVAQKARQYWLAEQEEELDADQPAAYDTTYDWNP